MPSFARLYPSHEITKCLPLHRTIIGSSTTFLRSQSLHLTTCTKHNKVFQTLLSIYIHRSQSNQWMIQWSPSMKAYSSFVRRIQPHSFISTHPSALAMSREIVGLELALHSNATSSCQPSHPSKPSKLDLSESIPLSLSCSHLPHFHSQARWHGRQQYSLVLQPNHILFKLLGYINILLLLTIIL